MSTAIAEKSASIALKTTADLDAIVVKNDDDASRATVVIKQAAEARKTVEAERNEYVRPAKEIIENAKRVYDPIINGIKMAEQKLRDRVRVYLEVKEEARLKKVDVVVEKNESGELNDAKAVRKLEKIGEAKKSVAVEGATLSLRKVRDIKIVDESVIPDEYWVLDTVKLKKVALAGLVIPGVEVIESNVTNLR